MAVRINSNPLALQSQRQLSNATSFLKKTFERLASGSRINRASDDAAGLAIAERLRAEIDASAVAARNTSDGFSLLSIADGALEQVSSITTRLKELATQSANGTLSDEQRSALQLEFSELTKEVDRITASTTFNGEQVLGSEKTLQVGTSSGEDSQITVSVAAVDSASLGLDGLDISTQAGAHSALDAVSGAVSSVAAARGSIGSSQSRLEASFSNIQTSRLELASARSRIVDADFALEAANLVQGKLRQSIGVSVQAQANLQPQLALQLLRNDR